MSEFDASQTEMSGDIAIVGMAAQLPGALGLDAYWDMLRSGTSAIRRLSEEDMLQAGVDPATLADPNYVPFAANLEGYTEFDADFFGLSPKEAAIMDPQHRKFLEVSWHALENAGHMPENFTGPIGVYAGCGMGSYFYFNICSNRDLVENTGMFLLRHTGNDKDFLSTRLSHFLDLRGPSISLQTACSTSLVGVHYASAALLNGECDMAIAGGVTIDLPQGQGYLFKENEILSPDGQCHAFDHRAQGTVFGSGAGAVVLRRLEDAIADRDHIWAVIKGTAVNNDGSDKAGYLAPSVGGQAAAIAEAQAIAGVSADTVDYIECHGTGTYLGDPIEVAALTEAFRETTDEIRFCRIGSVKTNIGHLDTAAGAASLIKTALSLHHKQMPPSLGYEAPNPAIEFDTSPFTVNDTLTEWTSHKGPRRAGVNSLGVGGTNAHAVVEEAPERAASEASDWPFQVLTISGRNKSALDANTAALGEYLQGTETDLADVAFTLKEGRRAFERRRVVVAQTAKEAAEKLAKSDPREVFTHRVLSNPEAVFMFPGGGAQYAGMARDLYETEPVFAEWIDAGLEVLQPRLDYDIRALWLPEENGRSAADEALKKPSIQLPLIMIVEYALAKLLESWGITPRVLIGHSMGENTAAALAGVISFEDCIGLVLLRGQMFDTVPAGGMLSVSMPAADLREYLGDTLDLAAINGPNLSVASGPQEALDALQTRLGSEDIDCQRIPIDIAAHSRMLEPILTRFGDYLRSISLNAPSIPIISNRTGHELTHAQATDPDYWVQHLRGTVHFADGISHIAAAKNCAYIEVGPGKALSSLAQQCEAVESDQVINVLRHPEQDVADDAYFMSVLGRLWAVGFDIDWPQIWGDAARNKVVLPGYQFQRSPYFIEASAPQTAPAPTRIMRRDDIADWGYVPHWQKRYADCAFDVANDLGEPTTWLFFVDEAGVAAPVIERLRRAGHSVTEVVTGDAFARLSQDRFALAPEQGREGYDRLLAELVATGRTPERIAHFWSVTQEERYRPGSSFFHRNQEQGFYSLMFLAQAISGEGLPTPLHISVFSSDAHSLAGQIARYPEKACLNGPVKVTPAEFPGVTASWLDISVPPLKAKSLFSKPAQTEDFTDLVLEELLSAQGNKIAAVRAGTRYEQTTVTRALPLPEQPWALEQGAAVLITGGFGGIGQSLARDFITRFQARIVLVSRKELPDRASWDMLAPADPAARYVDAVQALEALGGEVLCLVGDVCNAEDMRRVREQAEARFGPLTGIIHAAGVIDDAPILAKGAGSVEAVFTPKIHGTEVIGKVWEDGALDWLVLFSSSSTVTAPAGQIDYVAANDFLNAYANARQGDATRVIALGWGVWAGVGMAADAMAARLGTPNVLPARDARQPLLDILSADVDGRHVFETELSVDHHWVLSEHRTKDGTILMPGTGYLEIARQALRALGINGAFSIRDLYFLRPLDVGEAASRKMRVRLSTIDAGFEMEVLSEIQFQGRTAWQRNAQASLVLSKLGQPDVIDLASVREGLPEMQRAAQGETLVSPQEAHLDFGPRWRVLNAMSLGQGSGIAELSLPPEAANDTGFGLHPALMDLATGWAMGLIDGYGGDHLWVPLSYSNVRVFRDLPSKIISWVRSVRRDGEAVRFDLMLCTPEGEVCAEIDGFSIKRIEDRSSLAHGPAPHANELEFDESAATQPLSTAEERLHHNIAQGIRPDEGADAFARVMSLGVSQITISSLDLDALKAQGALDLVQSTGSAGFERPDLDSDYAAPESEIERTLAGMWQDLLGVSDVGIDDSFFDLGGHSLIAVRLFAQIKKAYRLDFPISILFEAPTIRKISALIEAQIGPQSGVDDAPMPKAPERRFTHIVPMHEGARGNKAPFFLVAGMFGNVLNLRHLAHLLGADRPFYGLQARGLYGDQEPHRSIEDAARDYIVELQEVQPHGPYMLGGFSGGGITAYEMARQLEAAGEQVDLVVLLDTPLPKRRALSTIDRLYIQGAELKRGGLLYPLRWIARRVAWEISKRRAPDLGQTQEHQFHNAEIEAAFLEAVAAYEVRPWHGNLQLYRPPLVGHWTVSGGKQINSERAYVLHDNDWTQHAPKVQVTEVPGDHDSMVLEPNVRVLAARMKAAIEAAETAPNAIPDHMAAE
ncbi:MAG: SDR family NAD(P)-dependent oxidoreductase [Planktotalea sp.]|uniref:type I polyketide synthase n=1 Tax=Planktotalea sp. TaxID=2029877 RepID=UPI003C725220